MKHRIEWCHWRPGVDDADQDWREAAPNAGIDLSSRAACEEECRWLALDTDGGGYGYRVVEIETDEALALPRKTTVQRWDARVGQWFSVTVEIAS